MNTYRSILFLDFDGTICFDKFWRSLPPAEFEKVQQDFFQQNKSLIQEWMRGGYTAEEVNKIASAQTGIPYKKLWDAFQKDCKTMNVSFDVLEKIQELRERFVLVLTTGNMDSFFRFTVPSLGLEKYFDHIACSYEDKRLKTDNGGETYILWAKQYAVPKRECITIDDSESVCGLFKKLGGTACLVREKEDTAKYVDRLLAVI